MSPSPGFMGPSFLGGGALEHIEGYELLEKIGEGGMGQVYRALHRRLDRQVAIKRLAPQLSHNQDMLKRFLQEARLQARLPHPNVVSIFDLIENEQGIFLIMEYVAGQTARAMLGGRERLTMAETLVIAEGVLCGLAFMHQNGVVHRDIKPSNIMVSADGRIKVTDFGIARLVEEESGLTRFGGGIGTLHYMAPELIRSGTVSFSVDIYSLGATLHELLSGSPPFVGNTDLEIMMGHLEKEPLPLDRLPDDAAGMACRALIARALAKAPADRFPDAESFLEEVRQIRALLPPLSQWPAANPSRDRPRDGDGTNADGPATAIATADIADPADATSLEPAPVEAPAQAAAAPESAIATPQAASRSSITPPIPASPGPKGSVAPAGSAQVRAGAGQPKPAFPRRDGRGRGIRLAVALVAALGLGGYFLFGSGGKTPPSPVATQPPAQTKQTAPPRSSDAAGPKETAPARDAAQPSPETPPHAAASSEEPSPPATVATTESAVPGPAPTPAPAGQPQAGGVAATVAPKTQIAAKPAVPALPIEAPAHTEVASPAAPATTEAAHFGQSPEPEPQPAQVSPEATPPAAGPADQTPPVTPAVKQEQKPAKPQALYIAVDDARLRAQPSDTADILTRLDRGTRVTALGRDGDWIRIAEPGGRTGFVSAKLTATSAPPPPPAPAPAARPTKQVAPRPAAKSSAEPQTGWRIVK